MTPRSDVAGPIDVFIDGLAEPTNPGIGTFGYVAFRGGVLVKEGSGLAGMNVTNNFAEYEALVQALMGLGEYHEKEIHVLSDSQLLVNQMAGRWKVKKGAYKDRYLKAKELASSFSTIDFTWIPRSMNQKADELTRIAYALYSKSPGHP